MGIKLYRDGWRINLRLQSTLLDNIRYKLFKNKVREVYKKKIQFLSNELMLDEMWLHHNISLNGGALYSIYHNKKVNDYDFFCRNKDVKKTIIEHALLADKKGTGNAITIGDCQIVTKWVGEPQEIINAFDFKHNMCYAFYDYGMLDMNIHIEHLDIFKSNKLIFNEGRARDFANILLRIPKFIKKGFTISKYEQALILKKLIDQENEYSIDVVSKGFSDKYTEIPMINKLLDKTTPHSSNCDYG